MDTIFLVQLIISFFAAGIWITCTTLLAERLGSKLGGLIGNLPSTLLIGLLFVGIVKGTSFVSEAVPGVSVGMTLDTIFMFLFIVALNRFGLGISAGLSLIIWFGLAVFADYFNYSNLWINSAIYFIVTISAFYILERVIKIPSEKKSRKKYSIIQLSLRGVFAGSVVASVLVLSKFSGPFLVGIFTTFPAVLMSTMLILALSQSNKFAQATGKILLLSSSNIVVYGIAVHYFYPSFGLFWGTIISYLIAFLWIWIFRPLLHKLK